MPYNSVADIFTLPDFLRAKCDFKPKNGRFFQPPLGGSGATYDDHIRYGKHIVDCKLNFFARCYGVGWGRAGPWSLRSCRRSIGLFKPWTPCVFWATVCGFRTTCDVRRSWAHWKTHIVDFLKVFSLGVTAWLYWRK